MAQKLGGMSWLMPQDKSGGQAPVIAGEMEYAAPVEPQFTPRFQLPVSYGGGKESFGKQELEKLYGGPYHFESRIGDMFSTKDKDLAPRTVATIVKHSNDLLYGVNNMNETFGSEDAELALVRIYEQMKSRLGIQSITPEQRAPFLDQMFPSIEPPPTTVDPAALNPNDVSWNQRLAAQHMWRGGDLYDAIMLLMGPRKRALDRQKQNYEIQNKNLATKAERAKAELGFMYDDQKENYGLLEKMFGSASDLLLERQKAKAKQVLPKELDILMNRAMASDASVDNREKAMRWKAVYDSSMAHSRNAAASQDYPAAERYRAIAEFARSSASGITGTKSTTEEGRVASTNLKKAQTKLTNRKFEYIPKEFALSDKKVKNQHDQAMRRIANEARRVQGYLDMVSVARQAATNKQWLGYYNLKFKDKELDFKRDLASGKFTKDLTSLRATIEKTMLQAAGAMERTAKDSEDSAQAAELRRIARAYRRAAAGQTLSPAEQDIVGNLLKPSDIDEAAGEIISSFINSSEDSGGEFEDDEPGNDFSNFDWE